MQYPDGYENDVGPQELVRWTGGTLYQDFAARGPETIALRFVILRTPKCRWSGGVEKSNSRVSQNFDKLGFGSQRTQLLNIASGEIMIRKIPIGEGKGQL